MLLHCILGHGLGLHDIGVIFFHLIKLSGLHEKLKKKSKANFKFVFVIRGKNAQTHTKSHFIFVALSFGVEEVFTHFLS